MRFIAVAVLATMLTEWNFQSVMLRFYKWLLLPSCIAGLVASAHAQMVPAKWSPQVWVNAGAYSVHFDRSKDFREDNIGLGAEVGLAEDHALTAGTFINSERARSRYGAYQWRPLHWRPAGVNVSAGIALGAFDGYPGFRDGGWFLAALPMLAVEYERVGVNLFIVPTISNRVDGAVSVQFKLRLW
ncbi:MAG: hypothetical protein OEO84_00500 [Betaproteobacteria bacterium]|nr:hypothetical protein [Betaproteobacteria bacterium]